LPQELNSPDEIERKEVAGRTEFAGIVVLQVAGA
jgi:hypothetical protein